jgi:hypothetical protein
MRLTWYLIKKSLTCEKNGSLLITEMNYWIQAKLILDDEEKKIPYYILAIEYDINRSPISHYKIATILLSTNHKKANVYYRLAIKLNKNLIDERISYFLNLGKRGYLTEGRQVILEIVQDFPTNEKAQNLLKIFSSTVYSKLDDTLP